MFARFDGWIFNYPNDMELCYGRMDLYGEKFLGGKLLVCY